MGKGLAFKGKALVCITKFTVNDSRIFSFKAFFYVDNPALVHDFRLYFVIFQLYGTANTLDTDAVKCNEKFFVH